MGFLDSYEDVAARIQRLHQTHPSNRVETRIVEFNAQAGYILVECSIFKEYEDEKPSAIDFAFGRVESYNPQMKRWFVEDTVTSAIGRCAGLLLGSSQRPTKQNMEQVEQIPAKFVSDPWTIKEDGFSTAAQAIEQIDSVIGSSQAEESPHCAHGHMILKEGTKKDGKPYRGYLCPEKKRESQCPPKWQVLSATTGEWRFA